MHTDEDSGPHQTQRRHLQLSAYQHTVLVVEVTVLSVTAAEIAQLSNVQKILLRILDDRCLFLIFKKI